MMTDRKFATTVDISFWYNRDCQLYQAIDLMKAALTLDLTKRVAAADALKHPFLLSK